MGWSYLRVSTISDEVTVVIVVAVIARIETK